MKDFRLTDWLPTTKKEMELRGWDYVDVILFSGDAYVDHPSFGAAVIGRVLATGWRLFPNRTGMVISAISRNWDGRAYGSVWLLVAWIRW